MKNSLRRNFVQMRLDRSPHQRFFPVAKLF
jgi:hypothetical protein